MPNVITGNVIPKAQTKGTIQSSHSTQGAVRVPQSLNHDTYNGEYELTPKNVNITMETKNKIMNDNVTLKKVPSWEVSNSYGTTFVIGE